MNTKPFTLGEAVFISNYFQSLVGQKFAEESFLYGQIECVAVAPFEPMDIAGFITHYKACRDPHKALYFYKGTKYEVLVIARVASEEHTIAYKPISEFLVGRNQEPEMHMASYTFPVIAQL